nr:MAG TPA: hypothetical protein [Caudoviricetes sp.]
MEGVSSGAIGEFRKVVDTATTEYNDNHNLKLAKYNANASEKLTIYDTNDEQHTTDYNRNAEQKMEAYNQNATTKTAEFDANAAALQTEVDRLRGECDNLAAENRKQENKISALMKLNKGQTYDILPEEGETASRTAPSGSKYVSVDKVGGKSIVWNQLCNPDEFSYHGSKVSESDGMVTITECESNNRYKAGFVAVTKGHKYYQTVKIKSDGVNPVGFQNYLFLDIGDKTNSAEFTRLSVVGTCTESGNVLVQLFSSNATDYQIIKNSFMLFDLTLLFGAGNEPTAEQFERMFPSESYPYNAGEIISSRTATITAGAETITTGFPELRSAIAAHDYIDIDGEQTIRNIGKIKFNELKTKEFENGVFYINHAEIGAKQINASCLTPGFAFIDKELANIKPGECNGRGYYFRFKAPAEINTVVKFMEKYGNDYIYFELETPTTEQGAIPEALQEWLPVEPGGTVIFKNADESKQLAVPNAVSWVRKLDEVE